MKLPAILNTKAGMIGAGVLALGVVAYFYGRRILDAVANVNKGTPYEGAGVVGTLGNVTNQISGGTLEKIGSAIGSKLYDWFGDDPPVTDTFYTVTFPDGSRHAVNAATVTQAGYFTYSGVKYKITSIRSRDGGYTAERA